MAGVERVLIVGAGMAGLALATALRRAGLVPDIIERADRFPVDGAGIYLVGNAMRALERLGVADTIRQSGAEIPTQTISSETGRRIVQVDTASVWSGCGPCIGARRTDLLSALAGGLGTISPRFSTTLTAIDQNADTATVHFDDGSTQDYDLVIGADGIRSSVRAMAFGGTEPRFCGQVAWRFLTRCPASVTSWSLFVGKSSAFLIIPVGQGTAYCYADASIPEPMADPVAGRLDRLRSRFQTYAAPVQKALAGVSSDGAVHFGPIEEILQQPWSAGNILLIGDAAHACSPNMASGAALAFEDALVVAELIKAGGDAREVIGAYTDRRFARAAWIQDQTHKRDRLRNLPPLVRNLLTRLVFQKAYRSSYAPMLKEI